VTEAEICFVLLLAFFTLAAAYEWWRN